MPQPIIQTQLWKMLWWMVCCHLPYIIPFYYWWAIYMPTGSLLLIQLLPKSLTHQIIYLDYTRNIIYLDMRAGMLNEIVAIFRQMEVQSDFGDISTSYQFMNFTRASVEHSLGKRKIQNEEIFYDYSKIFTIWKYVDVQETDRIKYRGKFYRVVSIEPQRQHQLILTELVND